MKVEVRQLEPGEVETDLLAAGLHESGELPAALVGAPGAADAAGGAGKLALLHPERPARALVAGLGKREEADVEAVRLAAARVAKRAAELEATSLAWLLPESDDDAATAAALVTGTVLGAYRFDRFKSEDPDDPAPPRIESLTVLGPDSLAG